MSSRGNGTKSYRLAAAYAAAAAIALSAGTGRATAFPVQWGEGPGAAFIRAASDLDWLLYKPNTDYLNFPNRQPGYREPGDAPYVPEPLPAPPAPGGRSAPPLDEPHVIQSSPRWRKGMLACEVVRQRVAAAGYSAVRATDCAGAFYEYTAIKGEARFRISARAKDGFIVSETGIKD